MVDENSLTDNSLTNECVIDFTTGLLKYIGTTVGVIVLVTTNEGTEVRTNLKSPFVSEVLLAASMRYDVVSDSEAEHDTEEVK